MTTKVTGSVLANTAVTAGTYGGSTQHAVVTVDAQGRLTLAANATPSIANSQITGVMTASQLAATAVTTGTYGGAGATPTLNHSIPVITVDQQGRLTSAANVTITNTAVYGNTNQITANTATGTVALGLASTAVTPATYGGASVIPVVTIDQQGRATFAANATPSIANTQITGVITAAQHANTAVTAGTYGGAAAIPVIVVDQQGRLTSAANVAFSISGPSANVQTFNTTGTWTKPTGDYRVARIQCWGGGGGGGRAASLDVYGGGGGGYFELTVPLVYLASTVTATVGASGSGATTAARGGDGGLSSFALATAWNGISAVTGGGGGGGGITQTLAGQGAGGGGRTSAVGGTPGAGYVLGNLADVVCCVARPADFASGLVGPSDFGAYSGSALTGADSWFGGGSSGGQRLSGGSGYGNGGSSNWGGGGGTATSRTPGRSYYGGAGGAGSGVAGTAPAGGGGCGSGVNQNGGNGAAGRIIVTCW